MIMGHSWNYRERIKITELGEKLSHCHIITLFLKGKFSPNILNVQRI
jgi:hypothetical protein